MKEDSLLICPIAYEDPSNIWPLVEEGMVSLNPLRDVTWKSQLSSSLITINKLPIKFLSSNAGLFKDSDHPFRWFLAPYIHIHIVVSETLENYKSQKSAIRRWVTNIRQTQRSSWLLLFVPTAKQSIEVHQKIFTALSSDAVQMRRLSSDHAQSEIPCECPVKAALCLPVWTSHTRSDLSAEVLAKNAPHGEKRTEDTASVCPVITSRCVNSGARVAWTPRTEVMVRTFLATNRLFA